MEAFRAKHPELGHKEIVSKGAEEWSKLTDEQKVPYNKLYEAAKEEYTAKLQALQVCVCIYINTVEHILASTLKIKCF